MIGAFEKGSQNSSWINPISIVRLRQCGTQKVSKQCSLEHFPEIHSIFGKELNMNLYGRWRLQVKRWRFCWKLKAWAKIVEKEKQAFFCFTFLLFWLLSVKNVKVPNIRNKNRFLSCFTFGKCAYLSSLYRTLPIKSTFYCFCLDIKPWSPPKPPNQLKFVVPITLRHTALLSQSNLRNKRADGER